MTMWLRMAGAVTFDKLIDNDIETFKLALIVLVLNLVPIIGANAYAQMKYGKGFNADAKTMCEEASRIASDAVGSIRTVALSIELVAPDTGKAMSSAVSVFAILNRKSEIYPNNESGITLDTFKGEIDFRQVSFKYPTRPDVEIFRDPCLTIQSGKTVALVGESGSGKSTLTWVWLQMGLVSQEPVLFNDTIRANISYGTDSQATETERIAASELANVHEFICVSDSKESQDTTDEDTSALDAESERVVLNALDMVMVSRTAVVVAHRLSTIKGADVIVVIENAVIVEKGSMRI
ncbi:ABC transporter B family member 21-like protein [Tanacetum coccineum]|uniref:ABC transporter B family member 21-like protein n=1 Tax=Tanacetum coccineum TaxID=301880 RepID=A0ABQ5IIF1_9ASTR